MLISAIVPNYNHGALIGDAVRALVAQIPAPDEIVVVDDCSTDDSIAVLQALGREFPTLHVIQNEHNQGAIGALNIGLQEAHGEYVYFGAADDFVQPGLFARMLAALEMNPKAAFACCEALVVDQKTGSRTVRPPVRPVYRTTFLSPQAVARTLSRMDNWIITGTALARRHLIIQETGFDDDLGSFADGFLFRLLALRYGCCYIPSIGLTWQVSDIGYSRSAASDPAKASAVLNSAIVRMRNEPTFPSWYPDLFARRWRFAIARLAVLSNPFNTAVLCEVSARSTFEKTLFKAAAAIGGPIGQIAILGWLFMRERPTSLVGLAKTAIARKIVRGLPATNGF